LLVEGDGGPLGVCIAAAHVHDVRLLKDTLDAVVVERPEPTSDEPRHLCLDKGYDSSGGYRVILEQGYVPHVRRIGEEKLDEGGQQKHPARRWVVERTFAWLSRRRGILIRWDKKAECYLALVKLACALLWFRRLHRLLR
jgi:putative transposase